MDIIKFKKHRNPIAVQVGQDVEKLLKMLSTKDFWCQRALAKDVEDNILFDPFNDLAVKWDILGLLHLIDASGDTFSYLDRCSRSLGFLGLDRLNDLTNYEYVIDFLKECLKTLKKQ